MTEMAKMSQLEALLTASTLEQGDFEVGDKVRCVAFPDPAFPGVGEVATVVHTHPLGNQWVVEFDDASIAEHAMGIPIVLYADEMEIIHG